ncbi:unnamed protein product [Clonostachys byssicola]|uniref:DUF7136 domain-containing protein n=1 Tax=Clonostachys byssicola TaxID=160290 RepID=A0A9N9XZ71_9HYPO|nr:unnamed protein product [Clonostachys byssicola]
MLRNTFQLFCAALAAAPALVMAADGDTSFPKVGELDVVFPRNDTYAVVSPFPVIFGFQRSNALLRFGTYLEWQVSCPLVMSGIGFFRGDETRGPTQIPYYYVNESRATGKDVYKEDFHLWRGESKQCTLSWKFEFGIDCKRYDNGTFESRVGYYPEQSGSVNFTLAFDGKLPHDAIAGYEGCPVPALAVEVQKNLTGCPEINGAGLVDTKPCDLDVKSVASSLAAAVAAPTITLTEAPGSTTTSRSSTTRTTSGSRTSTTSATGSGTSNNNDNQGSRYGAYGSTVAILWCALIGVFSFLVFI